MGLPTPSPCCPLGARPGPQGAEPCLEPPTLFIIFLSHVGFSRAQASPPGRSQSTQHCLPRLTVPWAADGRHLQGTGFPGVQPRDPRPGVSSPGPFLLA